MFYKRAYPAVFGAAFLLLCQFAVAQQAATRPQDITVHLQVDAGTPLRLYITQRTWYRMNAVVEAKFAEPVWAFDRVVIPAGAAVEGRVTELDPVPTMIRAKAIVGGDFTPLKRARISFTTVTLPDGRSLQLATRDSLGLATIYVQPRNNSKQKQVDTAGKAHELRQAVKQQATAQINARTRGFFDFIRGPNKREWLENFFLMKLPYHPQWYRSGTRFDAVLEKPLDFGNVAVSRGALQAMGSTPPPDSTVQMRILTTVSSADAHTGDPMQGVLSQPLFTQDRKVVLPAGTRLNGKITLAKRARLLHRGGKLRFAIETLEVPTVASQANGSSAAELGQPQAAQAQLATVEADPKAVKVDQEGTAKATESKTRLLRPAIAALVAAKSMDNDEGRQSASGTGGGNASGQSLGGFSGFGLLGIAAAQGPRQIGSALGFYGLAWSVYSNIIARGREVTFQKNAAMEIRFGAPPGKR